MRERSAPSAGSEGVKKSRKWVATARKIRTLQHVANPISEFLHTLSAGATHLSGGGSEGGRSPPPSSLGGRRWNGGMLGLDVAARSAGAQGGSRVECFDGRAEIALDVHRTH